jgi:hypothetical protein
VRRRISLWLLKIAFTAMAVLWVYALFFLVRAPTVLNAVDRMLFDQEMRNQFIVGAFSRWLPFMFAALLALLGLVTRSAAAFYGAKPQAGPLLGDRVVENVRTHGRDRRFRTSLYWATTLHIAVFIAPLLLMRGCSLMTPYSIPKGSGEQIVKKVVVKRVKKKKKKRLVLNMNSPILYYVPDLKDSKISEEIDQETMDQYQATSLQSGMGKGGGRGGWPEGMENARVRFIRLEYAGGDWDQDMGKGSDYNFLIQFRQLTGFRIADETEHIRISDLKRFPDKRKPPFVFITGRGGMRLTSDEVKILRWYCTDEGGMIFADNGGGHFNGSFRSQMRRVFPDLDWIDIASDDPLFRSPYVFPNGAPPLWHHSGNRALGLKHNGRWIVFYHQGDVNDAWKTGHSGASPFVAQQAYRLGVNIVYYAFNQYIRFHYGD